MAYSNIFLEYNKVVRVLIKEDLKQKSRILIKPSLQTILFTFLR